MSICEKCGAIITWRRTRHGNWQPYNPDGTIHFPTCRQRIAEQRADIRRWYARLRIHSQIGSQKQ